MSSPLVTFLFGVFLAAIVTYFVVRKALQNQPPLPSEMESDARLQMGVLGERISGHERTICERDQSIRVLEESRDRLQEELNHERTENARLQEGITSQAAALVSVSAAMKAEFAKTANEALKGSGETFLNLAEAKLRDQQTRATGELGTKKAEIEGLINPMTVTLKSLDEKVLLLKQSEEGLLLETQQLSRALKESKYRGNWGELQLKRIAELAGMQERCDFHLQDGVLTDENRRLYPDMTARLPNDRVIVVDSKVSFDAYREAVNATDPEVYKQKLSEHAKAIRKRVAELSGKEYRSHVTGSADFVVYFIPGESYFSAALAVDPELLEYAAELNVILASPTTLLTLLRAVALGWTEAKLADDAKEICEVGRELYERLRKSTEYIEKVGNSLESAVDAYDSFIGSMERRIFPQARRFGGLVASDKELPEVQAVDKKVRKRVASDWSTEHPLILPALAAGEDQ